jgi:hypothetical protein
VKHARAALVLRLAACTLLAGAACNPILGIDDVTVAEIRDDGGSSTSPREDAIVPSDVVVGGDGGEPDVAPDDSGADIDASIPQPHPGCVRAPLNRAETTIQFDSNPALSTAPLKVTVIDTAKGFTNVNITICTPTSATPIVNSKATVESGQAPFRWSFDAGLLPPGVSQVGFRADPNASTLVETTTIEVR